MGVAVFLGPIMLLFLLIPVVFVVVTGVLLRGAVKSKGRARGVAVAVVLALLAFPAWDVAKLLRMEQQCADIRPVDNGVVAAAPVPLLIVEEFDYGRNSPVFFQPNARYFDQARLPYIFSPDGKLECRFKPELCADLDAGRIPYVIRTVAPMPVPGAGPLDAQVTRLQVVEHRTGRVLSERREYVMGGFIGAYHGLIHGHPGRLACGYLAGGVGAWRPKGGTPREIAYRMADDAFLKAAFPWLKTSSQ